MGFVGNNEYIEGALSIEENDFLEETNWSDIKGVALEELEDQVRSLLKRFKEVSEENTRLQSELRSMQKKELKLQEENAVMAKDLQFALSSVEKALDQIAVES